ncbi:MAG TPA: Trm112 family protein [Dyella sp.]|uniref:Trm112 family protein n=1 Tax=Dyella sp. TaxID=1869338 RepID=UPI002BB79312|nr:Trm112 family protein [Dyella sp.]HTV84516.1 Trm112 family protein [Dyella sp.]
MDKRLLDILCCPVSKTPLRLLNNGELAALNRAIDGGQLLNVAGGTVQGRLAEGLITVDRKVVYRVEDGIPVMLPEEGIGTPQLTDFPPAP